MPQYPRARRLATTDAPAASVSPAFAKAQDRRMRQRKKDAVARRKLRRKQTGEKAKRRTSYGAMAKGQMDQLVQMGYVVKPKASSGN